MLLTHDLKASRPVLVSELYYRHSSCLWEGGYQMRVVHPFYHGYPLSDEQDIQV